MAFRLLSWGHLAWLPPRRRIARVGADRRAAGALMQASNRHELIDVSCFAASGPCDQAAAFSVSVSPEHGLACARVIWEGPNPCSPTLPRRRSRRPSVRSLE